MKLVKQKDGYLKITLNSGISTWAKDYNDVTVALLELALTLQILKNRQ